MIRGAGLAGPIRHLAASAQVLELTFSHVKLRLASRAFATEANRHTLGEQLSRYFGAPCSVEFEVAELSGDTVADEEARERIQAHNDLVDGFRNDPFVREVVALFNGTIDEMSVKPQKKAD